MNRLRFRDNRRERKGGGCRQSESECERERGGGGGEREIEKERGRERTGFIASCCSQISGDTTVLGLCRFHIA